jgi:hypothetical protein
LILEKYCIFLNAVESFTVFIPILLKFIKFNILDLSFGAKIRCAGVRVEDDVFLFW